MTVESPNSPANNAGITLDRMPPSPPGSERKASMMELQANQQNALGPLAGNPQVQALKGMQMMEQGAQLLSSSLPGMTGPLSDIVAQLRQLVPQAVAAVTQPQAGPMGGGMLPPPPQAGLPMGM